MSDLMLDVGLANELKLAFRRNNSGDRSWTSEKIKSLSEGDTLARVLDVLDGRAEIRKINPSAEKIADTIIRVNRSDDTIYPAWVKERLHKKLELSGPSEYDIGTIEEWYHPEQENGVVKGEVIYTYQADKDMLKDQLSLADLLAIKTKGIVFFRRYYFGKAVFGWKSVVRDVDDDLLVPYLIEYGGEVILFWYWLGEDWDSSYPALRFASK
jgi:molybdopterin converting factor small subunit